MVMKPEPIVRAVEHVIKPRAGGRPRVILFAPQALVQSDIARELAKESWLVLICGHMKESTTGASARSDDVLSIGDFVLTGGEPAAIVLVDAVARLLPAPPAPESAEEVFGPGTIARVSAVHALPSTGDLRYRKSCSGNHGDQALAAKGILKLTLLYRPDLLREDSLTEEDRALLQESAPNSPGSARSGPGTAAIDFEGEYQWQQTLSVRSSVKMRSDLPISV